ncbi:prolipoprotein diacylglyceryl transferase [Helicobacter turcicus]|uniref:Phosphatidylglycerol--prolipoprotein diacylglyceryl transferase n=1 Tax=Helicobacter turcicus TaxID=2867412 RepID=A0ABS7JNZ1_9HELI|nr:prolipoprotein diacylglyceryl transferase [Helicobacter turcicus]MBX7491093.1 prolipoprotein diacylglyceryl transferase [Helicobacter turcicus]MBX7545958.1 prolipoprotein diacylglyceryl transferase [Helicobacter turcicus]
MTMWNTIYSHFEPVAFSIFGILVHWYGIMYVLALLVALFVAKWLVKKDSYPISNVMLDSYFIWAEVGVILGARLGYIIFYDPYALYYLGKPWQIFNPFDHNGQFVGIRGMSYHGAVIGFLIASILFAKAKKMDFWLFMDLAGLSIPLGYVFGRIGNFLNQELVGRETTSGIGILVDGILRHPSQLYEAFLEGIIVFVLLYLYRKRARFIGEIGILYGMLYSLMRFIAEFFREPDAQLGFIAFGWLTQGQLLSLFIGGFCFALWLHKGVQNKGKNG